MGYSETVCLLAGNNQYPDASSDSALDNALDSSRFNTINGWSQSYSSSKSLAYTEIVLDEVLLEWADEVVVMDNKQDLVVRSFGYKGTVHVLNVPDNYGYRDPELVELLTDKFLELYQV